MNLFLIVVRRTFHLFIILVSVFGLLALTEWLFGSAWWAVGLLLVVVLFFDIIEDYKKEKANETPDSKRAL